MSTTLEELNANIKECERRLAPGSESTLLGDYNEAMRRATGELGLCCKADPATVIVPDGVAAWWRMAYKMHHAESDDADSADSDLQDFYERVDAALASPQVKA